MVKYNSFHPKTFLFIGIEFKEYIVIKYQQRKSVEKGANHGNLSMKITQ